MSVARGASLQSKININGTKWTYLFNSLTLRAIAFLIKVEEMMGRHVRHKWLARQVKIHRYAIVVAVRPRPGRIVIHVGAEFITSLTSPYTRRVLLWNSSSFRERRKLDSLGGRNVLILVKALLAFTG